MNINYNPLKNKVAKMNKVTAKQMFGYQCYSVLGKFFVGFSNKNDSQVIVRLEKKEQELAIKKKGIKPFSHGAKMGWIEIDSKQVRTDSAFNWITKGYNYAKSLAKN